MTTGYGLQTLAVENGSSSLLANRSEFPLFKDKIDKSCWHAEDGTIVCSQGI